MSKKNDDPPLTLVDPDKMMVILIIACVITLIAFVLVFRTAKVEKDIDFEYYRNEVENSLQITKREYLLAQAPPYLMTEHTITATITAYNPVEEQCDSTPLITASGKTVREGYIACPAWLPFGTDVFIDGKKYTCEDRMSKKHPNRFDIMMWDYEEAIEFGKQIKEIIYYKLVK